ncbi:WD domain-containing protein 28 [Elsinoe australis]|uniref:WD domain-containing protein 28 n=1 Tax=Elsinoe australis TaxID=40998 RepID=A0A4V6DTI3_9PEZI|nr:WD domain-containing protein 28 [Elsinoe australis]
MVTFEDDDDPAVNSGDESQDEDETMADADGDDNDNEGDATMADEYGGEDEGDDDDNGDNDDDDEDEAEGDPDSPTQSRRASRQSPSRGQNPTVMLTSPSPRPTSSRGAGVAYYIPPPRPEAVTAGTYDIVPTMAAPQGTSINAVAATPDMRLVFSGGTDGYIRMYNWVDTANGKVPLTVAQKHPFVDSVMKAGSLTTYWENEEVSTRTPPAQTADESKETSPVYSLAVQHQAVWLLSGLESGAINLQTTRHQAGTRIATLREHTSAVSVLKLGLDETTCLSGSWDKRILEWDLNTGRVKRSFPGSGGQISAIEVRPESSVPVPKLDEDRAIESDTFSSNNNAKPTTNGMTNGVSAPPKEESKEEGEDAIGSPDGSLFGENDHGSLFGDNDEGGTAGGGGGGGSFGDDDDDDFSKALANGLEQPDAEDSTANVTSEPAVPASTADKPPSPAPVPQPDTNTDTTMAEIDFAIPAPSPPAAQQQNGTASSPNPISHPTFDAPLPPPKPSSGGHDASPPAPSAESTFLAASIDGTIRIWDRRVATPITQVYPPRGTPPWCMGACWSPDGNSFYAGRRNGTVDEYSVHMGGRMGEPVRTLRFPAGSGAVSAVRAMPNGRGLVCASYDILRLYDLKADQNPSKHSAVPFLIVPGHRTGMISALHVDPSCRFMISTAGNRGWEGSSTEVLLGYEIGIPSAS